MSFLYLLENIRCAFLDGFMNIITYLGDEYAFLVLAMIVFWCVDKFQGYYVLFVGFIGTQLNQLLKVIFRIERPWVIDKNFKPVEGSIGRADGYSFPSGHTQSAVGTFGAIARWSKNNVLRIICVVLFLLVGFSRMYLGVHTPKDVLTSLVIALVLVFALYPIIKRGENNPKIMYILFGIVIAWSLAQVLFMELYPFPADANGEELFSATKNAYKLLGAVVGMLIAYIVDRKYINFSTKAVWWAQIIKVVVGLGITIGIQKLGYTVFALFCSDMMVRALTYFTMVIFAGCIWPLTFKWYKKK